jgi:hypothetical protein
MSEGVKHHPWEGVGLHQPSPVPAEVVRREQGAFWRSKEGRLSRLTAQAKGDPYLPLMRSVSPHRFGRAGGQRYGSAAMLRFGLFQPKAGFCFL